MTDMDPVSQSAANRMETNLHREIAALKELVMLKFGEHDRRLDEANNAHALATIEKQKTDAAATRIQETAATKDDMRKLERDVLARLDVTAGATAAQAKVWSIATAIGAGVLVGLIMHFLT